MTTEARETELFALDSVDEKKIRPGMAFPVCSPGAFELVIPIFRGKTETSDKKTEHLIDLGDIAFLRVFCNRV